MGECLRQRWGVCIYAHSLSFSLWHAPVRAHMLRRTHRLMNRFKMFILCFSPETSLLVSHTWEHPLGRLRSDTRFDACFLMPTVSAGVPELSRGTALAPSSRRSWEMGLACPGMPTLACRHAAIRGWSLGNSPAQPCYKPRGCCLSSAQILKSGQTSSIPQDHVHIFPEPSFKSGSHLRLRYGIDLWSIYCFPTLNIP